MSDKYISLESLKEYSQQMKETYIEPLKKEIEGETTIATFNITKASTTITLKNLTNMTSIDWGDGTVNSELTHVYINVGKYKCKIYGMALIGQNAFYSCGRLTSITIPDSVMSIGNGAFYECYNLTSITIPDSVTNIGNSAFEGCRSLTSITIPDSVKSIGYSAFYGCHNLTSITIPDSVTSIGDKAFYGCRSLTSITIPDSVKSIGYSAFYSCGRLTSITIPDNVTSIGAWAFSYCSSLTSVTIGNSVTSIGDYAFFDCGSLTSITTNSITPPGIYANTFEECTSLTKIIVLFDESLEAYKTAEGWSDYATIIDCYVLQSKLPKLYRHMVTVSFMDDNGVKPTTTIMLVIYSSSSIAYTDFDVFVSSEKLGYTPMQALFYNNTSDIYGTGMFLYLADDNMLKIACNFTNGTAINEFIEPTNFSISCTDIVTKL